MSVSVQTQPEVVLLKPTMQTDDKTLFGKMLVNLRNKNEVMLIALLGENTNFNLKDDVLTFVCSNEQEFKALTKSDNLNILNSAIKEINPALSVKVEFKEVKAEKTMEELLKEKLGTDLKVN